MGLFITLLVTCAAHYVTYLTSDSHQSVVRFFPNLEDRKESLRAITGKKKNYMLCKPGKQKCESFKKLGMKREGVCAHLPVEASKLQSMVIPVPLNSTVSLSRELDVHTDVKK